MEYGMFAQVLSVILGILAIYFGFQYAKFKKVVEELAEAVMETSKAIEDDNITEDELKKLVKEWKDVLEVFAN